MQSRNYENCRKVEEENIIKENLSQNFRLCFDFISFQNFVISFKSRMLSAYHYRLHKVPCRCVDIKSVQLICSSCCVRRNSIERRRNIRERSELTKRKSIGWTKTILGAPENRDKLFLTKCDSNFLEYFQNGEMFYVSFLASEQLA